MVDSARQSAKPVATVEHVNSDLAGGRIQLAYFGSCLSLSIHGAIRTNVADALSCPMALSQIQASTRSAKTVLVPAMETTQTI